MSSADTPAPSGGTFPPPQGIRRGNGKLTAAGVLQIIQGGLMALGGVWLLWAVSTDSGEWFDDMSGGSITSVAIVCFGFAAALILVAMACIKGRKGGWVTVIVFQSIFLLGSLNGLSNPEGTGNAIVSIAFCGTALYLAIAGGRESQR